MGDAHTRVRCAATWPRDGTSTRTSHARRSPHRDRSRTETSRGTTTRDHHDRHRPARTGGRRPPPTEVLNDRHPKTGQRGPSSSSNSTRSMTVFSTPNNSANRLTSRTPSSAPLVLDLDSPEPMRGRRVAHHPVTKAPTDTSGEPRTPATVQGRSVRCCRRSRRPSTIGSLKESSSSKSTCRDHRLRGPVHVAGPAAPSRVAIDADPGTERTRRGARSVTRHRRDRS